MEGTEIPLGLVGIERVDDLMEEVKKDPEKIFSGLLKLIEIVRDADEETCKNFWYAPAGSYMLKELFYGAFNRSGHLLSPEKAKEYLNRAVQGFAIIDEKKKVYKEIVRKGGQRLK